MGGGRGTEREGGEEYVHVHAKRQGKVKQLHAHAHKHPKKEKKRAGQDLYVHGLSVFLRVRDQTKSNYGQVANR